MKIEMSEKDHAEFLNWCDENNPCDECPYNEATYECFPCHALVQMWHLLR